MTRSTTVGGIVSWRSNGRLLPWEVSVDPSGSSFIYEPPADQHKRPRRDK